MSAFSAKPEKSAQLQICVSSGRTRPSQTCNLRAVQLLLGHTKIESTVRYLGNEVDDAIEIAKKVDV
jgi:hypothetical protein